MFLFLNRVSFFHSDAFKDFCQWRKTLNGEKVLLADISQMDLACKKYKGRQCFPTAVAMIAYCVSGHSPDKMQKIHFHKVLQEGTDLYDTLIQLIETSTHPNHVYTRNVWERD